MKAHIDAGYYAPTFETAKQMVTQVIDKYHWLYPSAIKAFREDLEACLNHLGCPVRHRKAIRTKNLLECTSGWRRDMNEAQKPKELKTKTRRLKDHGAKPLSTLVTYMKSNSVK